MKRRSIELFLLFYAAFTFLVQIERTQVRLESLGDNETHFPAVKAQSQHPTQTRIAEDGFILHGFESTAALPEIAFKFASFQLDLNCAPCLLYARPRSPPVKLLLV
jgi:hypothetical protein